MLKLLIDNHHQTFLPLAAFRARWRLPQAFGITYFEVKDWPVGQVDAAGREALVQVKQQVVAAVSPGLTPAELLAEVERLTDLFSRRLAAANTQIQLREVELDFAVEGFQMVLQAVAYRLLQLLHTYRGDLARVQREFNFATIYQTWLDTSVQVFTPVHFYEQEGVTFEVRIVSYAYGRVGLAVTVEQNTYYVFDPTLACPAAAYMENLCRTVAEALGQALLSGNSPQPSQLAQA